MLLELPCGVILRFLLSDPPVSAALLCTGGSMKGERARTERSYRFVGCLGGAPLLLFRPPPLFFGLTETKDVSAVRNGGGQRTVPALRACSSASHCRLLLASSSSSCEN